VHDLFVLTNPGWFSRLYYLTHAPLLRAQIRSAAAVVAVSQPTAQEVASIYSGPIVVAPNAPSAAVAPRKGATAVLDRLGVPAGRYLLAVGSRDLRKNLARLAEAYARLDAEERQRHPLVVVGGGSSIFRTEHRTWPEEGVDAGYVSDEELGELYQNAYAMVLVSLAEGFGLPLVEAAACGTPHLVVSDIPVFRWICGDAAHYVEPSEVDSIADGLRQVLRRPRRQSIDLSRFDWDASARSISEVCLSLPGSSGGSGQTMASDSRSVVSVAEPGTPGTSQTRLAVVLASAGRPTLLAQALQTCSAQVGVRFQGIVSVPDEDSLPPDRSLLRDWRVVMGTRGLAAQRNAGLDAIDDAEVVAFFDDDAVLRPDYLVNALRFLDQNPDVVALTGRVLRDGATTGEIPSEEAAEVLAASGNEPARETWRPTRELYGCNFVVRAPIAHHERFDERLPLYSWLEDHDFARRCLSRGWLAEVDDCVIVHRATASGGRQAHRRLGYSQLMNPVYLCRKGSFPLWLAAWEIFRPVAKNVVQAVAGSSRSWRRERLGGNLIAAADVIRGRLSPERIRQL
jgi:GT2 family glycosyltransferase